MTLARIFSEGRKHPEDDSDNPRRFFKIKQLGRNLLSGLNLAPPAVAYRDLDPKAAYYARHFEKRKKAGVIADNLDKFIDTPPRVSKQGTIVNDYFKHFRIVHGLPNENKSNDDGFIIVIDRYMPLQRTEEAISKKSCFEAIMAHKDNFPEHADRHYVISEYGPRKFHEDGTFKREVTEYTVSPDNIENPLGYRTFFTVDDYIAEGLDRSIRYDLQSVRTEQTKNTHIDEISEHEFGGELDAILQSIRSTHGEPNSSVE